MASIRKDARKIANKLKQRTGCCLEGNVLRAVKDWLDDGSHKRAVSAIEYALEQGMIELSGDACQPSSISLAGAEAPSLDSSSHQATEGDVVLAMTALQARYDCDDPMHIESWEHLSSVLGLTCTEQLLAEVISRMEDQGALILDRCVYPWELLFLKQPSRLAA